MLKIEVIKFEAQDVITASTPVPEKAECTCNPDAYHYHVETNIGIWNHEGCQFEGSDKAHNCHDTGVPA